MARGVCVRLNLSRLINPADRGNLQAFPSSSGMLSGFNFLGMEDMNTSLSDHQEVFARLTSLTWYSIPFSILHRWLDARRPTFAINLKNFTYHHNIRKASRYYKTSHHSAFGGPVHSRNQPNTYHKYQPSTSSLNPLNQSQPPFHPVHPSPPKTMAPVPFTPSNPHTTTRADFTANILSVTIPESADKDSANGVRHQQGLYRVLFDHEAIARNHQQTFMTPAAHKTAIYHLWDFVGRTLQYFYMVDCERAWSARKGQDKVSSSHSFLDQFFFCGCIAAQNLLCGLVGFL